MMLLPFYSIVFLVMAPAAGGAYKVHELNDRFLDFYSEGRWLVMFYAPWCGHCRKLEPVWHQVAQHLPPPPPLTTAEEGGGDGGGGAVRVGRVDCTKYSVVASHFAIRGFPTIMFIDGDRWRDTYQGDRHLLSIIEYTRQLSQPLVATLADAASVRALSATATAPFFVYVGDDRPAQEGADAPLQGDASTATATATPTADGTAAPGWSGDDMPVGGHLAPLYWHWARHFRAYHSFYRTSVDTMSRFERVVYPPSVFVWREGDFVKFVDTQPQLTDSQPQPSHTDTLNHTLYRFINGLRFSRFVKVTHGNLSQLLETQRMLAVAVLQEDLAGRLPVADLSFRQQLQLLASQHTQLFPCEKWQFGWVSDSSVVSSLVATHLLTPSLLVLNMSQLTYYVPAEGATATSSSSALLAFLQAVDTGTVTARGGSSYVMRVYRALYVAATSLTSMWRADPLLTVLLFGLPAGFLALICYSALCHDVLDDDDTGDQQQQQQQQQPGAHTSNHEKND